MVIVFAHKAKYFNQNTFPEVQVVWKRTNPTKKVIESSVPKQEAERSVAAVLTQRVVSPSLLDVVLFVADLFGHLFCGHHYTPLPSFNS